MTEAHDDQGEFECITLRSGERAIRSRLHGESMHPTGPWTEANRLYVAQSKLSERLAQPGPPLCLYDVGLGAAANASAAVASVRALGPDQRRALELVSFERDLAPLSLAMRDRSGFAFLEPFLPALDSLRASGRWEEEGLRWTLLQGDFLERLSEAPAPAALVYYDPFSPKANPVLWTPGLFRALRSRCRETGEGCQLFTYSAATPTRVSLLLGGFFVGAGVSTGAKGETTVAATGLEQLERPLQGEWLGRWERSSRRAPHGEPLTPELEAAVRDHPQFRGLGGRDKGS